MNYQEIIASIKNHPTYKEILADSFGGVMYNVANQNKYASGELKDLWLELTIEQRANAGGIMKGVFNFLEGK